MTATVTIRVSFDWKDEQKAAQIVAGLPGNPTPTKVVSPTIFVFELPDDHPAVYFLLETKTNEWSAHAEITRKYSKKEISTWSLVHVRVIRGSCYAVKEDPAIFEFDPGCKNPLLPVRQVDLIALRNPLRARQSLVRVSNGAWLCKPDFLDRLAQTEIEVPRIIPVFLSRKQARLWKEDRTDQPNPADPLAPFAISPEGAAAFPWLQIHPTVAPLRIIEPTATGTRLLKDNPSEGQPRALYVGWKILSELYLRQDGPLEGDWHLTREFAGGSGGLFLPKRQLVVSKRCFEFLKSFSLSNLAFEPANVR